MLIYMLIYLHAMSTSNIILHISKLWMSSQLPHERVWCCWSIWTERDVHNRMSEPVADRKGPSERSSGAVPMQKLGNVHGEAKGKADKVRLHPRTVNRDWQVCSREWANESS